MCVDVIICHQRRETDFACKFWQGWRWYLGINTLEHVWYVPKDGELCLDLGNPREILVEAGSGTDVQIVRKIWM